MGKVFLFGPLIITNNWGFRTNILNISLDRNFPYIHDIVMGMRSVQGLVIRDRLNKQDQMCQGALNLRECACLFYIPFDINFNSGGSKLRPRWMFEAGLR